MNNEKETLPGDTNIQIKPEILDLLEGPREIVEEKEIFKKQMQKGEKS